jgi:hypothetical protein
LAYAIRDMEKDHVLSQTDFNRRIAAQRQVEAVAAAYETDTITLDVLLKAQQQLAQAESDYYRALVDYNKSISQVHFRKGSLLEYNGVYLAEGPWPGKAYFDARRRARAREASTYLDYGFTQPRVISRGPIEQQAGDSALFGSGQPDATAAPDPTSTQPEAAPELVPTPEPESIQSGETPAEPAAPLPVPEPQASGSGAGKSKSGWSAVVRMPAGRTVDTPVNVAGWAAAKEGSSDEAGKNPPHTAIDRPASGWKGVQH